MDWLLTISATSAALAILAWNLDREPKPPSSSPKKYFTAEEWLDLFGFW